MRLSAFNLYVEDYPTQGDVLVHNTFADSFAVIDSATLACLRAVDSGEAVTDELRATIDELELADPNVGVVVDSRAAEEAEFRAWFERKRSNNTTLSALISVNRACNFECSYCCQAEVMDGSVLSEEDADKAAAWLASRAREVGAERVHITFCGGEPLLHPGRIERIARTVAASGVVFSFGLITNGYFLDGAMLDRLVPLGLANAQITLDGDGSTHAITRISKRGEDTYRRVFDQAIAASRRIRVSINGNYQANTLHGFAGLIDELATAGLPEGSKVSFSPALEALSASAGAGSGACTFSGSDTSLQLALTAGIDARGFDAGGHAHAVGPCEFHDHHSFAIDTDGSIHKCPGFLGHPDWRIGHVASGLSDRYERMLRVNPQRDCGGCAHRPNCGGGCIAAEWLRAGRMDGVNCEVGYFERVQHDSVIRSFQRAIGEPIAVPEVLLVPPPSPRGQRAAALRVLAA